MFSEHRLTPDLQRAILQLPPDAQQEVLATFRDYANLLKIAGRDREALLGFVDNLQMRLDDIPMDYEAAREKTSHVAKRAIEDAYKDGAASGHLTP